MAESHSVWPYPPSLALAIIGTVLYGITFLATFYQTFIQYRAWFFTCVVVGAAVEVAGYILRSYSAKNQEVLIPFILTLSFIVIAPVLIAAGNYLLIGRLIRAVLPPTHHKVFGIPARLLTAIFVVFDIISCMVQSSGSGIASSDNWQGPNEKIGTYILIGGLSFQCLTLAWYLAIFGRFHWLAVRIERPGAPRDWRKVVKAVYVSSTFIMVRSIYRVGEFSQGIDGYAFRHEWLFWIFEAVPMLIAIGIFCIHHPGKYLGRDGGRSSLAKGSAHELRELSDA